MPHHLGDRFAMKSVVLRARGSCARLGAIGRAETPRLRGGMAEENCLRVAEGRREGPMMVVCELQVSALTVQALG